jgi:hypothetical protein
MLLECIYLTERYIGILGKMFQIDSVSHIETKVVGAIHKKYMAVTVEAKLFHFKVPLQHSSEGSR